MGFFDFLGSPVQDPTLQDQELFKKKKSPWQPTPQEAPEAQDAEALRIAQYKSELAQDAAAPKTFSGLKVEKQRHESEVQGLGMDLEKAKQDARSVINRLPGFGGSSFGRYDLSDQTRMQVAEIRKALHQKGQNFPEAFVDDFERLSQNAEFKPEERKAMSGVAAMFRRAQISQEQAIGKKAGFTPTTLPPELIQREKDRRDALARQEDEARERLLTMGITNPQRPGLQNTILELSKERFEIEGNLKQIQSQEAAASTGAPPAANATPVTSYMDGLGIDKETLVDRVRESMNITGIPNDKWDDDVDPKAGLLRVMGAMDPKGSLAQLISAQMANARAQDGAAGQGQQAAPESEESAKVRQTEAKIAGKEAEMRALYAQLAEAPFMRTWPGIILYVLVGMLTQNPAFAARLLGGVGNREAIDREIKGLQFDLRRLDDDLARREQLEGQMKREAASRLRRRDDEAEDWKRRIGMELLRHNLIIERNAKRGNPETALMKKLSAEFQRSAAMAAKFSKTKDDPLVPEAKRSEAEANFRHYMQKAAALDVQLSELGGDVLDEEAEE